MRSLIHLKNKLSLHRALLGILLVFACVTAQATDLDPEFSELRAKLTRLRQEDPEAFQNEIRQIKQNIREHVNNLKYTDPEAYQELVERRTSFNQERLDQLKEVNPQKFYWLQEMRRRRLEGTVSEVGSENPEALQKLRRRDESFRNWSESNPRIHRWIDIDADGHLSREEIRSAKRNPEINALRNNQASEYALPSPRPFEHLTPEQQEKIKRKKWQQRAYNPTRQNNSNQDHRSSERIKRYRESK